MSQAAEAGDIQAQYNLAQAYDEGQGVAPDLAKALKWSLRAAERGRALAQNQVAEAYRWGERNQP
ncbi:MAG: SEL1-like repeat protein [Deltaproteobacteria bacterium]|nr:SEL1-like repeat protein [Deltaproteobacteria bacterium]